MVELGYIGLSSDGQTFKIDKYPLKELCEQIGIKHAQKIYVDTKKGQTKHIGYVIGGLWISVYKISGWKD